MRILLDPAAPTGGGTATIEAPAPRAFNDGWLKSLPALDNPSLAPVHPEPAGRAIAPATPPPEPPKPQDPPPAPPEEDDLGATVPRTAEVWKNRKEAQKKRLDKIKGEYDAKLKAEQENVTKLTAEMEALKKQGPSAELDSIKQRLTQYEETLNRVRVEENPKFKAYFDGKKSAAIESAKAIVGAGKAAQVEQLLNYPDSPWKTQQLEAITEDMPVWDKTRLAGVANELAGIERERQGEIARAKEHAATLATQEKTQREQTQQQAIKAHESAFEQIFKELSGKEGSPIFQKREGKENDGWNKEVDDRIQTAKDLVFKQHDPPAIARAAAHAAAFPALAAYAKAQAIEIETLKGQIAKLSAANPSIQGGTPAPNGEPTKKKVDPTKNPFTQSRSFAEAMVQAGRDAGMTITSPR